MEHITANTLLAHGELMTTAQAAQILKISPRTLEAWRLQGIGPNYIRISGRCIRYTNSALDEWLQAQTCKSLRLA